MELPHGLSELDMLSNVGTSPIGVERGVSASAPEVLRAVESLKKIEQAKALVQQRTEKLRAVRVTLDNDRSSWQRDWVKLQERVGQTTTLEEGKKGLATGEEGALNATGPTTEEAEVLKSMRKVLDRRAASLNSAVKSVKKSSTRLATQEAKMDGFLRQLLGGERSDSLAGFGFEPRMRNNVSENNVAEDFLALESELELEEAEREIGMFRSCDVLPAGFGLGLRRRGLSADMYLFTVDFKFLVLFEPKISMICRILRSQPSLLDSYVHLLKRQALTDRAEASLRVDQGRLRALSSTMPSDEPLSMTLRLEGWAGPRRKYRDALASQASWMREVASEVNRKKMLTAR